MFFHAPWVLCRVKGVGMSDVKVVAAEGAYQQGESITGLRREGRTVKVTLHLLAGSRQEMYRLRSELLGILSPDKAFDGTRRARLIYENDFGRRWTWAVPESGLDWGERKQNAQPSLNLNFRCESPYWYGMTRQEAVFRPSKTRSQIVDSGFARCGDTPDSPRFRGQGGIKRNTAKAPSWPMPGGCFCHLHQSGYFTAKPPPEKKKGVQYCLA